MPAPTPLTLPLLARVDGEAAEAVGTGAGAVSVDDWWEQSAVVVVVVVGLELGVFLLFSASVIKSNVFFSQTIISIFIKLKHHLG